MLYESVGWGESPRGRGAIAKMVVDFLVVVVEVWGVRMRGREEADPGLMVWCGVGRVFADAGDEEASLSASLGTTGSSSGYFPNSLKTSFDSTNSTLPRL